MRQRSSFRARWLLALLPWLVVACATAGPKKSRPSADKPWIVVGLARGVDARAPAVAGLVKELSSRARVEVVKAAPRAKVKTAEGAVKRALAAGRRLYLRMQMEEASEKFERALERVRATFAKELTSKDLAQLHLYLAAVRYAKRRTALFRRHCRAAASYDSELVPNADIFSPPVRRCIKKARAKVLKHEVTLAIQPPDATLIFDGVAQEQGKGLGSRVAGEHFLRVEHALYQSWGRVLHLSAKAHVEVELRPVAPPMIVNAALERPSLAKSALPLLGAHALVLLRREGGSTVMLAQGPRQELRYTLSPIALPATLASQAESITRIAAKSPSPGAVRPSATPASADAAASRPSSRPGAKPSLWKSPWLWGAVAAGVLVAVIVPLATMEDGGGGTVIEPGSGRPVRLELSW